MSYFNALDDKSPDLTTVQEQLANARTVGKRVVFTNGCFDILHYGHVSYLSRARDLGDLLIVGLNGDESVRRLKGPSRPINDLQTRRSLLAALACTDFVLIFDEDTPARLISVVRPDVLVKGGDYAVADIVGADFVQSYGGEVRVLPFEPGNSTTDIVEKIKKQ